MFYLVFCKKGKSEAEGVFPQGKHGFQLMTIFFPVCLLVLSAVILSGFARAEPFKQKVSLDVKSYVQQMQWRDYRQEIITWLPNKATELPACQQNTQITLANQNRPPLGRVHYLISCATPKWQIRAQAKVKLWLDVWHAKNNIMVEQVIGGGDIFLKNIEISRITQGFFSKEQTVINKRSVRRLRAGKMITNR